MFDLLDAVLAVAVGLFALSGWRQGLVVGVLSLAGFLGGAVLGARLAPSVSRALGTGDRAPVVGVVVVFAAAVLGQGVAGALGRALRGRLLWRPLRTVDSAAGAVVSAVSVLLVAWLLATALDTSRVSALSRQVHDSGVLSAVDGAVPDGTRSWFTDFRRLVDDNGFPQVFSGLSQRPSPVAAPDPALAATPALRAAERSVVKVRGSAPSCARISEGSGVVYAPDRVLTNAHVVAGVVQPRVDVGGRLLAATVVVFDPRRDVAVLLVPGLSRPALPFAATLRRGQDAVVAGFPGDGPFRAAAARVRDRLRVRGYDIYSATQVTRDVYALRAVVRPGNSGGPLLAPSGAVAGIVFAESTDDGDTGYALTAAEVGPDAALGRHARQEVGTQACD